VRSNSLAIIAVLIFAAALRLLRMHVRWDEITLAYAAYAEPLAMALSEGHPTALMGSWIGLHPPLWGAIHAVFELVAPVPWVWLSFSALCSLAAVWLVGRMGGWLPALVLASAPVHLLDSAEINNYPIATLAMALLIYCARGAPVALALAAVFATWCHLLTGVAAAGVVLWRSLSMRSTDRRTMLTIVMAGILPVLGGAWRLMGQGSTWGQPDVPFEDWLRLVTETIGFEGLILAPVVMMGLAGTARVAWLSVVLALALAVGMDAAAAHQRPYLGIVAPAAAIAIGFACQRRSWLIPIVAVLCVVRGGRFAVDDVQRLQSIMEDLTEVRGVDVALEGAADGATLWLVSPALQTDDDKTANSSVLWRIRPWEWMPIARPVTFEYKDYRYGQPRHVRGLTLHTSTELYEASFDHVVGAALERGREAWVVVYDHGPATGLMGRIDRVLQPYDYVWQEIGKDVGLGVDKVALIRSRR